jgi:MSHA biogenesis protein MshO
MRSARLNPTSNRGFTLIELVVTLIVLSIVSVGITGFISSSTQIFIDASERERLLREGSFAVERINREISAALPNSLRLAGNAGVHCLEFVPIRWSSFYLTLPVIPTNEREIDIIVMQDIDGNVFTPAAGSDYALVYPVDSGNIYSNTSNQRRVIAACSDDGDGDCATKDDADGVIQLTLDGAFSEGSPARRVYIANSATSYCVRNNAIYRHESTISETQTIFVSGGVLMAENLANKLSADPDSSESNSTNPFRIVDASLRRNAYTQTQLIFTRDGENITFTQEIHVPNVP